MKKKALFVQIFFSIFVIAACSKQPEFAPQASRDYARSGFGAMEAPLAGEYNVAWTGTGYNPVGSAGLEGQMPPAFKDMSNLYGETAQSADSGTSAEVAASTAGNTAVENNAGHSEVTRKLVKRATFRIRVENLQAAEDSVAALMEKYAAYAAQTETEENYREYVIRVPHAQYDSFLAGIGGMGRILRRSESAEDVTLRYYDLEGRLATRQELLKTFQSYLGKAKDITEILSVEERIADLQNEIDRTGKELSSLANLVDYATVSLDIYGPVASEPYRGQTLLERIKQLFGGFGEFLSTAALVLLGAVMYGIPVLLLLVLLFWLLFGRIGLLKKLWRFAAGRQNGAAGSGGKGMP